MSVDPPGEYANSCIGRERVFEHFAQTHGTRSVILRLSYALDMRYGVLHDIANAVRAGQPVPLGMGHCNVIWQGSANEIATRNFETNVHSVAAQICARVDSGSASCAR